ncbi:DUF58 domain-containing protein [Anaerovorax odorimutans]|uniref:DUF58 domain-containing protein n=1 Tax=Anaerovorax odorimutans TaxID=109327 RepID=A0ABT1RKD9_9FIRM|nr:DUF58 domain-containing protein [Anaerovorax odorimutans]MCQ4635645.1 DUF58 domain-containing protein [Anaerovorax odorimutans]
MLRNRVFYVLLLLAMAMIYIFTNTYYTLTLLGLCVLLPVISLALMLFSRRGLSIGLEVPGTAEKENAVFTYSFENSSVFPVARLIFLVQMENQMTGSQKTRKVNATVGGKKTVTARLAMKDSKVGTVIVSTKQIRVYDAFGLFALKKPDLADRATVVYPDMRQAQVYMEKPIETTGDGSRYSPDKPGQDVSEIFTLREYVPGDEVRKIHWKLSSKIDKMMVRDFSLPLNYSVFLLMELTKGKEDVVDAVVELYLSLSRALLESGINHNLAWYDAGEGAFHVRELDDFEDLEIAAAQVLSSYAGEKTGIALDYYAASAYRTQKSTLVYVASDPDLDKTAEMEVSQIMRTIYVYEDEKKREQAQQAIQMIPVSVKNIAEGIPEIMV